ncbi:hypothetical protein OUZ56_016745 [Daphnia magna]|uniref:Uncharacterized protein n=1 Tax=Daphnia magna TaxID=35525 RepID=A0ABR0ARF3_9CRUS|nr:hypothetical protein OUZ56_016745 [Daphnia magna]
MDRSYQDISIPIIVKTFGLLVFPIVPKSGVETVFLQPAPTQLPMRVHSRVIPRQNIQSSLRHLTDFDNFWWILLLIMSSKTYQKIRKGSAPCLMGRYLGEWAGLLSKKIGSGG